MKRKNIKLNSKTKNADEKIQELMRKRFRKRAGIEPVNGHIKSDHRLNRNYLTEFAGAQINVLMVATAFNFKKWMRLFLFAFFVEQLTRAFNNFFCGTGKTSAILLL